MNHSRNNIIVVLIAVLTVGFSLAFTLLQLINHLPSVISSVSWNL